MFGRQKRKVIDWLEAPSRNNEKQFHQENISLSDILWSLADETLLNAIEMGLEQVLMKRNIPGNNIYPMLTDEQVIELFDNKKISLFSAVSEKSSKIIRDRITNLLQANRSYATQRGMDIPNRDVQLTINQYYSNYKISKEVLSLLEIQTYKSK